MTRDYIALSPRTVAAWDHAFPAFFPSTGTHAAADRFYARYGGGPANWPMRLRMHVRNLRAMARGRRARYTRRERQEIRAHLGPEPRMTAALRFLVAHRRRARWAVRLRHVTGWELALFGFAWLAAIGAALA